MKYASGYVAILFDNIKDSKVRIKALLDKYDVAWFKDEMLIDASLMSDKDYEEYSKLYDFRKDMNANLQQAIKEVQS